MTTLYYIPIILWPFPGRNKITTEDVASKTSKLGVMGALLRSKFVPQIGDVLGAKGTTTDWAMEITRT